MLGCQGTSNGDGVNAAAVWTAEEGNAINTSIN